MIKVVLNAVVFLISSVIYFIARVFVDFWIVISASFLYMAALLYLRTDNILLFFVYALVLIYGLRKGVADFEFPSRRKIERSLEKENKIPHGSIEILDDHIALGQKGYWQQTIHAIKSRIPFLSPLRFAPETGNKDPYAFRFIAVLLFAYMFFVTYPNSVNIIKDSALPSLSKLAFIMEEEPLHYTGWITPPEYTKGAPILLSADTIQPIIAPEGSLLEVTLSSVDSEFLYVGFKNGAPLSRIEKTDDGSFIVNKEMSVNDAAIRVLDDNKDELLSWAAFIEEDYKPLISFISEPRVDTGSNVYFNYAVEDDYYPKSVTLSITPLQSNALYPNPETFDLEMPIGIQTREDIKNYWETETLFDFSNHSFSGMPVSLTLRVEDQTGKMSQTSKHHMTLPERAFKNKIAKQVVQIRSDLIQDYEGYSKKAMDELEHILIRPFLYRNDTLVFLSLKAVLTRLYLDRGRNYELKSVSNLLWYIAIHIEDGALIEEEQRLKELNQRLAKALGNQDLSDEDVSDLIDELEQALNDYARKSMQALLEELNKNAKLNELDNLNTALINPDKVSDYLNKMRDMISKGQKNEAIKMLQDLQNMLASMKAPQPDLSPEQKQAVQQYKHLQKLIVDQEKLLQKTKSLSSIEDSKERYREAQKTGAKQDRLRNTLEETKNNLETLMPKSSFGQYQNASSSMSNASKDIQKGAFGTAEISQQEALSALKKALENAQQAMEQQLGLKINDGSSGSLMGQLSPLPGLMEGYQKQNSNLDPFGKESNNTQGKSNDLSLDNESYSNKIKKIVNELRKRASETNRSNEEIEYLKRLLERF